MERGLPIPLQNYGFSPTTASGAAVPPPEARQQYLTQACRGGSEWIPNRPGRNQRHCRSIYHAGRDGRVSRGWKCIPGQVSPDEHGGHWRIPAKIQMGISVSANLSISRNGRTHRQEQTDTSVGTDGQIGRNRRTDTYLHILQMRICMTYKCVFIWHINAHLQNLSSAGMNLHLGICRIADAFLHAFVRRGGGRRAHGHGDGESEEAGSSNSTAPLRHRKGAGGERDGCSACPWGAEEMEGRCSGGGAAGAFAFLCIRIRESGGLRAACHGGEGRRCWRVAPAVGEQLVEPHAGGLL